MSEQRNHGLSPTPPSAPLASMMSVRAKRNGWIAATGILLVLFLVTWFEAHDACELIDYCV